MSIPIVNQGDKLKYYIDIENVEGFSQQADDFRVILRYGMQGGKMIIEKSGMYTDEDGRYFFMFDTAEMVGKVTVECQMDVPDTDYDDDIRTETDRQLLCFVAASTCPQLIICDVCNDDHNVTYTRTYTASMQAQYEYLLDANGNYMCTTETDGSHKYLLVLRS